MKILTVVGARPQFIKVAPVSAALRAAGISEYLLHTGQHYDRQMSEVFFEELGMRPPDGNLHVGSGSHAVQTGAMLAGIEPAIVAEKPDWVLVYGDTNSTLAGALAASKLHVPVAHVEAGLRSFNRRMPEEINRIVADSVSDILFVPTATAAANLRREGVPDEKIVPTGDVMYDAALLARDRATGRIGVVDRLGLRGRPYVLATIHRAENTDDPECLAAILDALGKVARELPVVFPVHPRTRARLTAAQGNVPGIVLIDPVGYLDMVQLEVAAAVVATDSGGVQKEAFFHGVPCVTVRAETEWVELVELGWNRLVDPRDSNAIVQAILTAQGTRGIDAKPYGEGQAARKIAETLVGCTS
jgi:UDP-GlcNAc3NAcA epimerase